MEVEEQNVSKKLNSPKSKSAEFGQIYIYKCYSVVQISVFVFFAFFYIFCFFTFFAFLLFLPF